MFLAALLDLGLELEALREALAATALSPFRLEPRRVMQGAIRATKLDVHVQRADGREVQEGRDADPSAAGKATHATGHHDAGDAHGHAWRSIDRRLAEAVMPERARGRAREIFRVLAEAEAKVHGVPVDEVHFHEVGALDSVLDICGAAIALDLMGIDEVVCDRIGIGQGTRRTAHGTLPVPTPATAEILRGLPVVSTGVADEMLTPTGAAILRVLTDRFEAPGSHQILSVGYGAGSTRRADPPNVLRITHYERAAGESFPAANEAESDCVVVLEAWLDDMTGEALGYLRGQLEEAGALDLALSPIQMKKNRPGQALMLIVRPEDEERLGQILLRESSTFGYRRRLSDRRILDRRIVTVETPLGSLRVKEGRLDGELVRREAEYEDLARIAEQRGLSLRDVERALREFLTDR